ncbi:Chemotaxis protein histidine kinase and related kinases [butyrate-producing bacterium SS3/4]|nr:Chemotaxis protein histidine kinase and related kinases [butyrate-producing bacterium SS3/4]
MSSGMDSSILDTYLYEENNLLDQLDEMLVADEKNGDFSTDDVNEIFRIMHTIKGSSAMMEFNSISTIAHHIEDVFFYIRDKGIETLDPEHKKELFNLMFRSEDYLRSEIEKVEQGVPLSTDIDAFSNEINSFLKKISGAAPAQPEASQAAPAASGAAASGAAAPGAAAPASLPDDKDAACFFHVFLEEGVGMENLRAYMIVNAVKECDVNFRFYPSDMETDQDTSQTIAENGFFLAFDSSEDASKAEGILKTQNHIRSYELVNVSKAAPPAKAEEKKASVSKPTAPAPASTDTAAGKAVPMLSHAPVKQNLISVNLMKLDSLMDIVGEIVITESMVTSSPELNLLPRDNRDNFMKSARQLRKLTNDLQDIAMSLRMVPISGVFQKMNRIVRDMKQSLGKDVRLTIVGEDTEVDKTIVDNIQDPIMHIVRNSMDHGIEETAQERIAAGKDPQGEIVLSASHTSSEVVISVKDDGYGMDPQKILEKARSKNMLTKPDSEYSQKEILGLIMLPGFSTNTEVTEYSGRGVGMDVVKKNVESLGGIVSVSSTYGEGTTISMKIPLTLAIVDGMKVTVGDSIFTIPIANIRQSFKVKADQVIKDEYGNEMVERVDHFYPIVRLHSFYHLPTEVTQMEDGILLWVEANDRSYCLFVDDLIGEQQVVVKPLPAFLSEFNLKDHGITGCTIMGDGNISIILDILSLYSIAVENA